MNSIKNKPTMPLWVGGLFLIAYMALFLGIGLRFEAASRARQENAERNEWLPVTAHVKSCFLVQDHPISAQRSVIFKIDCRFKYTVNGTEYIGSTVTIGPQHGLYRGAAPPPEAARMDNWAHLHPPGSLQVSHYNPKNPAQVSLAGADEQFRTNTAAISLRASNQILPLGVVLLLAAISTRYFTSRSAQSTSGKNR
jgi:hypothetical protein